LGGGGTDTRAHKGAVSGRAFRLMWDGPRGSGDAPCAGLAPPGSVHPACIPLKRIAPGSGLGDLGVDGGGGVAEWAKGRSCPRSARLHTIKTRPQLGCLYPGVGLRAARLFVGCWGCPFGGGDWAPGNAPPGAWMGGWGPGGGFLVRGEMRGAVPRRAEGPLSQLLGLDPCVWRRDRPILGRGERWGEDT
jgi:hypothetical protein